jgi:hypothetical protein
MALARHRFRDDYTTAELEACYRDLDTAGRLRLLKAHQRKQGLPASVVGLASEDQSSTIRSWLARTVWAPTDTRSKGAEDTAAALKRLSRDRDPLVRAAFWENPYAILESGFRHDWKDRWTALAPMERLAVVRNREFPAELVLSLFDRQDASLGLDQRQRSALLWAFLSVGDRWPVRPRKTYRTGRPRPFASELELGDGIWARVTAWPEGYGDGYTQMQCLVFRQVSCSAEQRQKTFLALKARESRAEVLRRGLEDRWVREARTDHDDDLRGLVHARCYFGAEQSTVVQEVLAGFDLAAMRGLLWNKDVSFELRSKVWQRMWDLGDKSSRMIRAGNTLDAEAQKQKQPKAPSRHEIGEGLLVIRRRLSRLSLLALAAALVAVVRWFWP